MATQEFEATVVSVLNLGVQIFWTRESGGVTSYIDFEMPGIAGIFRVADSGGVDLEKVIPHILKNQEFFSATCAGVPQVLEESDDHTNWGGGWEWVETRHPLLAPGYRMRTSTAWFTCPFAGGAGARQMDYLYPHITPKGVELMRSYDCNRPPVTVCYFHPYK